jgi:hypothetical protein
VTRFLKFDQACWNSLLTSDCSATSQLLSFFLWADLSCLYWVKLEINVGPSRHSFKFSCYLIHSFAWVTIQGWVGNDCSHLLDTLFRKLLFRSRNNQRKLISGIPMVWYRPLTTWTWALNSNSHKDSKRIDKETKKRPNKYSSRKPWTKLVKAEVKWRERKASAEKVTSKARFGNQIPCN